MPISVREGGSREDRQWENINKQLSGEKQPVVQETVGMSSLLWAPLLILHSDFAIHLCIMGQRSTLSVCRGPGAGGLG